MSELENQRSRLREVLDESGRTCGLLVQSPAMRLVWEQVERFAIHDAPVLVRGETGTGKELVARAIHRSSWRGDGPFVALACATVPGHLAEAELCGHEEDAFGGGVRMRKGAFERADGGTLLLDDVADLPTEMQVRVLRVLQEGGLHHVGGSREIAVNARVVATSEVDLAEAVSEGRFRGDLWERLCGLEIRLPPLREREDDIVGLAQHFLRTLSAQQGGEVKRLSTAAVDLLQAHGWPGNVSELKRSMESASLLCSGPEIQPEHLPDDVRAETASGRIFTLRLDDTTEVPLREVVRQFEDELIEWALRRAGGVPSRAAALLGLPRTTLQSKLARRRS